MADLLQRYLAGQIRTDLERKMVFVSGPRQVSKTTLARGLLPDPGRSLGPSAHRRYKSRKCWA